MEDDVGPGNLDRGFADGNDVGMIDNRLSSGFENGRTELDQRLN